MSPAISRLLALVYRVREREGGFTDIISGRTRARSDGTSYLTMLGDLGEAARLYGSSPVVADSMDHVAACALRIADYCTMAGFDIENMAEKLRADGVAYGAAHGQPLNATRWLAVMLHITDAINADRSGAMSRYPDRTGIEEHLTQALRALLVIGAIQGEGVDKRAARLLASRLNKELTDAEG